MRPISILPILAKIVKHVLKRQLSSYLEDNDLLCDYQCEFRSGRGSTNLLLGLTDAVRLNYNDHRQCVLLSMDLEKAFDRVDNCMILNKLHSLYGLRADAC